MNDEYEGMDFSDWEPVNPYTDWQQDFPDTDTWSRWVEAGWGAAPLTAAGWYGAGYGPREAMMLSRHKFPAPGTLEGLAHEDRYPAPTGDEETAAALDQRRRRSVDFDR